MKNSVRELWNAGDAAYVDMFKHAKPKAYRTYISGANAMFYDNELIESLKDNMWLWKLTHQYRSNWRVLHIDGIEGYPSFRALPSHIGEPIKFHYRYLTSKETVS